MDNLIATLRKLLVTGNPNKLKEVTYHCSCIFNPKQDILYWVFFSYLCSFVTPNILNIFISCGTEINFYFERVNKNICCLNTEDLLLVVQ